jgi:hypothetical protein
MLLLSKERVVEWRSINLSRQAKSAFWFPHYTSDIIHWSLFSS